MEKNTPLVSICMPAYNAEKYILDAVNSVINQTYKNWELIIINDGSTDNTSEVINTINDNRIKVENQENKGQCSAANRAFSLSNGAFIKFMDADDLISSNFIENQIKILKDKVNAVATASWGRFYNDDLSTFRLVKNCVEHDIKPIEWLVQSMDNKEVMLQCALWLIPKQILQKSGLWDESLSLINDFEFFIRVLLFADLIVFADDAIVYYRSNVANSLSGLKSRKGAESAYHSIEKGTSYMLIFERSNRIKRLVANSFQNFVYSFYPYYMDLTNSAEKKIKEMGGADVEFPAGGYTKLAASILGWKTTKNIKRILKLI